ncbi:hypothetical protein SKAU_G00338440 [Synaphobranchus kaupii]|uniref:Uncharacterized protein n=1 Tax=Synaphobranchus kaupii TaxID=118154 RepID=A0A9Q1EMK2_SYNKA|nr:hypothetical protein SKAU_G00338440 [Synaphobranchus kaupii]
MKASGSRLTDECQRETPQDLASGSRVREEVRSIAIQSQRRITPRLTGALRLWLCENINFYRRRRTKVHGQRFQNIGATLKRRWGDCAHRPGCVTGSWCRLGVSRTCRERPPLRRANIAVK